MAKQYRAYPYYLACYKNNIMLIYPIIAQWSSLWSIGWLVRHILLN